MKQLERAELKGEIDLLRFEYLTSDVCWFIFIVIINYFNNNSNIKIIQVMQDAKEILEFNKFMRKRLMEFYRLTKCPVPHSSMLFKRRKSF